jgi:hypothetical protein
MNDQSMPDSGRKVPLILYYKFIRTILLNIILCYWCKFCRRYWFSLIAENDIFYWLCTFQLKSM